MRENTAPQVQPVYQRLRAWRAGQLLLDTRDAHLYFPDDRQTIVRGGDAELWTYRHPDPEAAAIAGHVAAAGQPGMQILVDGTPERQP